VTQILPNDSISKEELPALGAADESQGKHPLAAVSSLANLNFCARAGALGG
jgi:hypothetical protein